MLSKQIINPGHVKQTKKNECIDDENALQEELETLKQQDISSMNNKLNVDMHSSDISACHTMKSGSKSRKRRRRKNNCTIYQ